MERDLQSEWDKLCEKMQVAQGEYMELRGMLVKKFSEPNRNPTGVPPSEGDFDRAEEARRRVERIQKEMDDFVNLHCR
jgi:hypothetical protein